VEGGAGGVVLLRIGRVALGWEFFGGDVIYVMRLEVSKDWVSHVDLGVLLFLC
jgi:hypothetical protein